MAQSCFTCDTDPKGDETHIYHVSDDKRTRVTYMGVGDASLLMDYKNQHQTTVLVGIGGNMRIKTLIIFE